MRREIFGSPSVTAHSGIGSFSPVQSNTGSFLTASLLAGMVLVLVALLTSAPVAAQSDDNFVVSGVTVEQSGSSMNDARSAAFDEGQRRAFVQLLDRLSVPTSRVDPQAVGMNTIANLIAATRVESESASGGTYRATLAVDFRPEAVRDLLREREATFTEVATENTVILPVYLASGGARLWEGDNPWHDAWRSLDPAANDLPVVVPPGDIEDVRTISAERAMNGDPAALRAMADRYDAGGAVVAVAEPGADALTVVLNRTASGRNEREVIRVSGAPTDPETFREAARRAGAFIRDNWRIETELHSGTERTMVMRVPLSSAGDWYDIQRRLDRMASVAEARVVRMAPGEIILEVTYFGSVDELAAAAGRERLRLDRGTDPGAGGSGADIVILRREG